MLAVYYGLTLASLSSSDSSTVSLDGDLVDHPVDRVTIQVEAAAVDPSTGSLDVLLYPVPRGTLEGDREGQLTEPLNVQLSSPGQPPTTFDFPAEQIVDPVAASVGTTASPHRFPFDRPQVGFHVEARIQDHPVPVDIELVNEAEGWNLAGAVHTDRRGGQQVDLDTRREMLSITFAVLYVTGVVVVALVTVAVIGGAIVHRRVQFDHVIWLGAMLVVIPALRNEMPGVPPIGTAVDRFVFLPAVVIVAVALLAAIVILSLDEATATSPAQDAGAEEV